MHICNFCHEITLIKRKAPLLVSGIVSPSEIGFCFANSNICSNRSASTATLQSGIPAIGTCISRDQVLFSKVFSSEELSDDTSDSSYPAISRFFLLPQRIRHVIKRQCLISGKVRYASKLSFSRSYFFSFTICSFIPYLKFPRKYESSACSSPSSFPAFLTRQIFPVSLTCMYY